MYIVPAECRLTAENVDKSVLEASLRRARATTQKAFVQVLTAFADVKQGTAMGQKSLQLWRDFVAKSRSEKAMEHGLMTAQKESDVGVNSSS